LFGLGLDKKGKSWYNIGKDLPYFCLGFDMITVTVTDVALKTKKVLDLIEEGRKVVILRHNKPVAVLMSLIDANVDLQAWEDDENSEGLQD